MITLPQRVSVNKKLGDGVWATYRKVGLAKEGGTCPATCSLLKSGACYALGGRVALQQRKAGQDAKDGDRLRYWLLGIPRRHKVRHLVSGDLMGEDGKVDMDFVAAIREGHEEAQIDGWGYTHAWRELSPLDINNKRVTFNASCESEDQAREALEAGWPTVLVLPYGVEKHPRIELADGRKVPVYVCPEQKNGTPCSVCKQCLRGDRKHVVGFMAHGVKKRSI